MDPERRRALRPTDEELVARCVRDDGDAWAALVARHARRVFNLALQFTGRPEEAEDVAQEIFLKLHRSLDRFDLSTRFLPWLACVARNCCIDHHRSRRREREQERPEDLARLDARPAPRDGPGDPYRAVAARERAARVQTGLGRLPAGLRLAVILRDLQGFSYAEISRATGAPLGTVKSRINRGRLELARILRADAARPQERRTWNATSSRASSSM